MTVEPSTIDLQRAFTASGLERIGWDFDRAMRDDNLAWSIKHSAINLARRRTSATLPGYADKMWHGTTPQRASGACHAVRQGDQQCCGKCGKQWDVNDPEPPTCGTVTTRVVALK